LSASPRCTGAGGFVDITQNAKCVVYLGTFTAKGAEYSFDGNELHILKEGAVKKMVSHVRQVSFNGPRSRKSGQRVVIVTERAVFELVPEGVKLVEIAPGIDLKTQVLDMMDFTPIVADDLKLMDSRLFTQDGPCGLLDGFDKK
jgi:propionate CoA-transferase